MDSENLVEPIVLDDTEIEGYLRFHRCGLCGSSLYCQPYPEGWHKYLVICPEHGEMHRSSVTSVLTMDTVRSNRRWADRQLNPEPPKSIDQILKDLGF